MSGDRWGTTTTLAVHEGDGALPPGANPQAPNAGAHSILGGWPSLPAAPLTTAQLADIAANPALVP